MVGGGWGEEGGGEQVMATWGGGVGGSGMDGEGWVGGRCRRVGGEKERG